MSIPPLSFHSAIPPYKPPSPPLGKLTLEKEQKGRKDEEAFSGGATKNEGGELGSLPSPLLSSHLPRAHPNPLFLPLSFLPSASLSLIYYKTLVASPSLPLHLSFSLPPGLLGPPSSPSFPPPPSSSALPFPLTLPQHFCHAPTGSAKQHGLKEKTFLPSSFPPFNRNSPKSALQDAKVLRLLPSTS